MTDVQVAVLPAASVTARVAVLIPISAQENDKLLVEVNISCPDAVQLSEEPLFSAPGSKLPVPCAFSDTSGEPQTATGACASEIVTLNEHTDVFIPRSVA